LPKHGITHYDCYEPPLPKQNNQLHQWEVAGLSYANNKAVRLDDENYDAVGALLQFSGNHGEHITN
jgi:hypothetical protein